MLDDRDTIIASLWGVLKAQARLASTGSTMAAPAARLIIGVPDSEMTSSTASELVVKDGPTRTSMELSLMSFFAFLAAVVVSDASSSSM